MDDNTKQEQYPPRDSANNNPYASRTDQTPLATELLNKLIVNQTHNGDLNQLMLYLNLLFYHCLLSFSVELTN
jgi:hypothetical protein